MSGKTLFEKIASREIPASFVYEDDHCFAIRDINPQAPTHVLIIPRRVIRGVEVLEDSDASLVGHLFVVARGIAEEEGLREGYRLVFNNGPAAGQSVDHLHLHLLGGRSLQWPPG